MVASSSVHKIESQFSEIARFVIAVTAAGAITRHVPHQPNGLSYRMSRLLIKGEDSDAQGRYCRCYDSSRFRILGGLAQQRAGPFIKQGIDPHQMMMKASAMPVTEFVDYSFVFVN
jgi:hypothetical protein